MKTEIEKLVISQPLARKLVEAGLNNYAAFRWYKCNHDGKEISVIQQNLPLVENQHLPAWTYEEIRIMIGNEHVAPDLREPRPNALKGEELTFCCYYLDRAENHKSGAEISGQFLLELIKTKKVKADDANRRYIKKFRPA